MMSYVVNPPSPIFSHENFRFVSFTQFPLLDGYFSYITEALMRHIIQVTWI